MIGTTSDGSSTGANVDAADTASSSSSALPLGSSEAAAEDDSSTASEGTKFDLGGADLPPDDCPAQTFCAAAMPAKVAISGMTPLGDVTLDHALFGPGKCECFSIEIGIQLVLSSAPVEPPEEGNPTIDRLDVGILEAGPGPQEVGVQLHRDGMFENGDAIVELTTWPREPLVPDETTRVTGTIELVTAGWTLQGEFDAPLCYAVGFQIPCE